MKPMDEQERQEPSWTAGTEPDAGAGVDHQAQPDIPPELQKLMSESAAKESEKVEPQPEGALSTLVLVTAGSTVFNAVLVVVYAVFWIVARDSLVLMLQGRAWISLLLGWVPMLLGAYVLRQNEKTNSRAPGTNWARAGVIVGTVMVLMSVGIPFFANLLKILTPVG